MAAAVLGGLLALLAGCSSREPADAASAPTVRLLTEDQYFNSLTDLFGEDVRGSARFAPFRRTSGLLALGASTAGLTSGGVEQYHRAAVEIASRVVDARHRAYLLPCEPAAASAPDDACARRFLGRTARLLFRRPVAAAELDALVARSHEAAARLHDFHAGLALTLEGMLVSPDFLFVVDRPVGPADASGRRVLDAASFATRLSLFLWNATPDEALLQAVESGELDTPRGRARAVDRMLASPRLEAGVRAFFEDLLQFDGFENLAKDPAVYPVFGAQAAKDAREQTLRTLVDQLLVRRGDYRDLFTTRVAEISPALAALDRIPSQPGWSAHEFPAGDPRAAGLLTQVSFLALHAHPARSSPTRRGKALRELLLCQKVPDPPPDVDFSAVENPDSRLRTARERIAVHSRNGACAGCHRITDPAGLALEQFDGAGRYRETEKGARIDPSGELDGTAFRDIAGLGAALRDNPALPSCLVTRLYSYAVGSPVAARNPVVPYLVERFADDGYRVPDLMRAIALSDAFSRVATPAPARAQTVAAN